MDSLLVFPHVSRRDAMVADIAGRRFVVSVPGLGVRLGVLSVRRYKTILLLTGEKMG